MTLSTSVDTKPNLRNLHSFQEGRQIERKEGSDNLFRQNLSSNIGVRTLVKDVTRNSVILLLKLILNGEGPHLSLAYSNSRKDLKDFMYCILCNFRSLRLKSA